MRSDKYGGRELTPEQKRYLEIVEEERRRNAQRGYSDPYGYDEAYEHHKRREKKRSKKKSRKRVDPYEAAYAEAAAKPK